MRNRDYLKAKKIIADFVQEQSSWPIKSDKKPDALDIYMDNKLWNYFEVYRENVAEDFWSEYPDWMEEEDVEREKKKTALYMFEREETVYFEDPYWGPLRIHFEDPKETKKRMAKLREEMYMAYFKTERQLYKYRLFLESKAKMQDYYKWLADKFQEPSF